MEATAIMKSIVFEKFGEGGWVTLVARVCHFRGGPPQRRPEENVHQEPTATPPDGFINRVGRNWTVNL